MRSVAAAAFLSLTLIAGAHCAGGRGPSSTAQPGRGAVSLQIVPNPILASRVSGNTYDFPFEVVIRETGGRPVEITRVSADVYAFGSVRIADESYDADRIRSLGYSTSIPANGEVRYRFAPRKEVPDDRLFGGVNAELRVDARDDTNAPTSATTSVTVRKN